MNFDSVEFEPFLGTSSATNLVIYSPGFPVLTFLVTRELIEDETGL
jgi:hypothetical protein